MHMQTEKDEYVFRVQRTLGGWRIRVNGGRCPRCRSLVRTEVVVRTPFWRARWIPIGAMARVVVAAEDALEKHECAPHLKVVES